jgi:hypothetical protein
VKAGPHAVVVAFRRKSSTESDEPLQPFTRDLDLQNMNGIPLIDYVDTTGPYQASGSGDTPSRTARTGGRRQVRISRLLLSFYQGGRNRGTFDSGVESALRLILADPKFLFRYSPDPPNVAAGTIILSVSWSWLRGSRSSYGAAFPDDQLLDAAAQGRLKDPTVLDQQVRRMLADPRAEALVTNSRSPCARCSICTGRMRLVPPATRFSARWDFCSKLRRHRTMAYQRGRRAGGCFRRTGGWDQGGWAGGTPQCGFEPPAAVCRHGDGEAADVRVGTGAGEAISE